MSRYRWIDCQKADGFPVGTACQVAEVSRSAWRKQEETGPSGAERDEQALVERIRAIHASSDGTYGSPRVTAELARQGNCVNHKRVERLMRLNDIVGESGRPRPPRTTVAASTPAPVPDLVARRFAPAEPDLVWAGDVTYIPTAQGWLYLASVLDLGSRRLLGYSMSEHMPAPLVVDALDAAVATRGGPVPGVIFHTDRGAQYLSRQFMGHCAELGVRQSVGRTGHCLDNAVAEAFWASLKRELVHRRRFATRAEARRAIVSWMARYNRTRLHSSLGHIPPIEWEATYAAKAA